LSKKQKAEHKHKRVAIVDIGASAIRLVISEVYANGEFRKLDRANRPVTLGLDVFKTRLISHESIFEALSILSSFQEMIKGWDVKKFNQIIIATSAVREARTGILSLIEFS
jgi:exopolyphosphatase/guanosine-5'-triphosphate,3'-diphosphate pyrophosphatase